MIMKRQVLVSAAVAAAVCICLLCFGPGRRKAEDAQDGGEEIPLAELFSERNVNEYYQRIRYVHKPVEIKDDPEPKRSGFIPPEEAGKPPSAGPDVKRLLDKLENGDRIERREAANALWDRFGEVHHGVPGEVMARVTDAVSICLSRMDSDFEENSLLVQRLWRLGRIGLITNVLAPERSVSENAARFLNMMKNEAIMSEMVDVTDRARTPEELEKAIFALEALRLDESGQEDRPGPPAAECARCFSEKVEPQLARLKERLAEARKAGGE